MKCGQIVKGKIDGIQKRFQSAELPQISEERLSLLTDQIGIGAFSRFFKDERVIARMITKEADNSDGRQGGLIRHIALYQYDRITEFEGEQYVFDADQFINKLPRVFKMPPFPEELKNPLPPLPPLEWEADV